MAYTDSLGEAWRADILRGVPKISNTGAVPGTILVWGHSARPILNSAAHDKSVLIAAAELGHGRTVVLAHESLLNSAPELIRNIETWLMKGEQHNIYVLDHNSKHSNIKPGDVMVWKGAKSTGDVTKQVVINHLLSGGGLLHAMCPWGWLQLNKGKNLSDMPLYGALDLVGICYTKWCGTIPKDGLDIKSHRSTESNHIVLTLYHILENAEHFCDDDSDDAEDVPILDVSCLPQDVCKTAVYPELRRLAQVLGCEGNSTQMKGNTIMLKKLLPKHDNPINGKKRRTMIDILNKMAHLELVSLPAVDTFPGCVPTEVEKICHSVRISSEVKDIHPTGFYLAKDDTLVMRVQGHLTNGWTVQVGAHSDNLTKLHQPLRRWPQLMVKTEIKQRETRLYSPYGGLIYLESPQDNSQIEVCLENVIEAPLFDVSDPDSIRGWKQRRQAHGLWADIMGRRIIITLPSSSVRNIEDPSDVMHIWDDLISGYHELRGTDPDKHQRQWIVTDEQPVAGYMHSGYPIVTHLDVAQPENEHFLLNKRVLLDKGSWGIYHEMGHNMQRPAWTFQGTGEVTCNVFTLYAMDTVSKQPIWIHEWLKRHLQNVKKYVNSAKSFEIWQSDPGLGLFIYAQIAHHFGWDVYKKVFREYEQPDCQDIRDNQQKIDTWFVKMSTACGYNLAPLFDFWKIPITDESINTCQHLQAYLPADEVTDITREYTNSIRDKYHI